MPSVWKDACGGLLEFPGPGGGILVCGALPGAAAPEPAWTAEEMAAAGVAAVPGPVREVCPRAGVGGAHAALLGYGAGPGAGRRARKITLRLAMQVELARALMPGQPRRRCARWRSGRG